MAFGWEISQDEIDTFNRQLGDITRPVQEGLSGLGDLVGSSSMGEAVQRAAQSPDIMSGASEIYAGALNTVSDIAQGLGMNMENVPRYTGESATAFWRGLAGDTEAKETPVTTRAGESTTLGEVKGYGEMGDIAEDVRTGAEGLGKAAQLGALTEIWNTLNVGATKPITSTANTIDQLLNIDNRGLL